MCEAWWSYFCSPTWLMPPTIWIYFQCFFSIKKMKHPVPSRGQQSLGQNTWMYFECFLHHCPHFIIQYPKNIQFGFSLCFSVMLHIFMLPISEPTDIQKFKSHIGQQKDALRPTVLPPLGYWRWKHQGWGLLAITQWDERSQDTSGFNSGPRPLAVQPFLNHCLANWLCG